MTSFSGAEAIVSNGDANQSDFWLFCGICGWETSAFYREMCDEGMWTIVSSDGGTILEELNLQRCEEELLAADEVCDVDSDSRNAGVHTWEMLMDMIGRKTEAQESVDSFGDLMLKEWATGALSFARDEGQDVKSTMISEFFVYSDDSNELVEDSNDFDITQYDPASSMTSSGSETLQQQLRANKTAKGTLLRASSATRSPFLFSDQMYHKSLVLILSDDAECSEGVILNHVTDCSYSIVLGDGEMVDLIVRYGGPVQCFGDENNIIPLTFLHRSEQLIGARIGSNVANGIFRCTEEEAITAMSTNLAKPDEFMVIQGLSMWKKERQSDKVIGGVIGDIEEGFFEPVAQIHMKHVWDTLMRQNKLSYETLEENLSLLQSAWHQSDRPVAAACSNDKMCVFGSDNEVTALADEALRRWMKAYFLGDE